MYRAVDGIEWRLGSVSHAALAVALADLTVSTARCPTSWGLPPAMLAYGGFRAWTGWTLLTAG
jgi:hypothetical protein